MGRKFQIWDSERFAPVQAERLKRALAQRNSGGAPLTPRDGGAA
jgi:hypothetical protein